MGEPSFSGASSHVAVFNWLEEQKTTSAIEEVTFRMLTTLSNYWNFSFLQNIDKYVQVNGVLLDRLVLEEEYVAVLFLGECLEEEKV